MKTIFKNVFQKNCGCCNTFFFGVYEMYVNKVTPERRKINILLPCNVKQCLTNINHYKSFYKDN